MTAIKSEGTCIFISDAEGSPALRVEIGEVKTVSGPGGQAAVIDVTNLKSAAKEKLIGLPDEGQVTFGLNLDFTDNGQREAWEARAAQEKRHFEIIFADAALTVLQFDGFVLEFSTDLGVDAPVDASMTVEITGAISGFPAPA